MASLMLTFHHKRVFFSLCQWLIGVCFKFVLIYRCVFGFFCCRCWKSSYLYQMFSFQYCLLNTCSFPKTTVISSSDGFFTCENKIQYLKRSLENRCWFLSKFFFIHTLNIFIYLFTYQYHSIYRLKRILCMNFTYKERKTKLTNSIRRYIFNCVFLRFMRKSNC